MSIIVRAEQGIADPDGKIEVLDAPSVLSTDNFTSPQNPNVPQQVLPDELFGITVLPRLDIRWKTMDILNGIIQSGSAIQNDLGAVLYYVTQLDKQYSVLRSLAGGLLVEQTAGSAIGMFPDPNADTFVLSPGSALRTPETKLGSGSLGGFRVEQYNRPRLFLAIRVWNFILDRLSMLLADDTSDVDTFVSSGYETDGQLYSRLRALYSVEVLEGDSDATLVNGGGVEDAIALLDISTGGVPLFTGNVVPVYTPAMWTSVLSRVRALKLLDAYGHMYALSTRTTVGLAGPTATGAIGGVPRFSPFTSETDTESQIRVALQDSLSSVLQSMAEARPVFTLAEDREKSEKERAQVNAALLTKDAANIRMDAATIAAQAVLTGDTSIIEAAEDQLLSPGSPPLKSSSPIKPRTPQPIRAVRGGQGDIVVDVPRQGSPSFGSFSPGNPPPTGTTPVTISPSPKKRTVNTQVEGSAPIPVSIDGVPSVAEFMVEEGLAPQASPLVLGEGTDTPLPVYDVVLTRKDDWLSTEVDKTIKFIESTVQGSLLDLPGIPELNQQLRDMYGPSVAEIFDINESSRRAVMGEFDLSLSEQIMLQSQMRPARSGGSYLGPDMVLCQARAGTFPRVLDMKDEKEESVLLNSAFLKEDVDGVQAQAQTRVLSIGCEPGSDLTGLLRFYSYDTSTDNNVLVPENVRRKGEGNAPTVLMFRAGVQYFVDFLAFVEPSSKFKNNIPHPDTRSASLDVNGTLRALMRRGYDAGSLLGQHAGNMLALCLYGLGGEDEVQVLQESNTNRPVSSADGAGSSSGTSGEGRGSYAEDVLASLKSSIIAMKEVNKNETLTQAALDWWGEKGVLIDKLAMKREENTAVRLVRRLETFLWLARLHSGDDVSENFRLRPDRPLGLTTDQTPTSVAIEQGKSKSLLLGIIAQAALPDNGEGDDIRGGLVMIYAMLRASTVASPEDPDMTILERQIPDAESDDLIRRMAVMIRGDLKTSPQFSAVYPMPSAFMPEEYVHLADRVRVTAQTVSSLLLAHKELFSSETRTLAGRAKVAVDQILSPLGIMVEDRAQGKALAKSLTKAANRFRPTKKASKEPMLLLPFRFTRDSEGRVDFEWNLTQSMVMALARPLAATLRTEDGVLGLDSLLRDWRLLSGARTARFGKSNGAVAFHLRKSDVQDPMVNGDNIDYNSDSLLRWGVPDGASVWALETRGKIEWDYFVEKRIQTSADVLMKNLEHFVAMPLASATSQNKGVAVARLNAFYERSIISPAGQDPVQVESSSPARRGGPVVAFFRGVGEKASEFLSGKS